MPHDRDAERPGRVIVGVECSLSGLQAIRAAVAQARARGTALHAVRCWQPSPPDHATTGIGASPSPDGSAAAANLISSAFADTMGGLPLDLELRAVVIPDAPGPVLVEYACRDDDLLVIGAGRHGRLRRWRSRVVHYCVTRARCPVLVVPPPPLVQGDSPRALLRKLRRDIDELTKH